MTCWTILKISQTKDKKVIKKAYAEQAKIYHPEVYPDKFKDIRKAYEEAMAYASGKIQSFSFNSGFSEDPLGKHSAKKEDLEEDEDEFSWDIDQLVEDEIIRKQSQETELIKGVQAEMETMYDDRKKRKTFSLWKNLAQSEEYHVACNDNRFVDFLVEFMHRKRLNEAILYELHFHYLDSNRNLFLRDHKFYKEEEMLDALLFRRGFFK